MTWTFDQNPYPGMDDSYPGLVYPSGAYDVTRGDVHERQRRWSRIAGHGTCVVTVDGQEAFPRTVEHDIVLKRGRTSWSGKAEAVSAQVRLTGVHDPAVGIGSAIGVRVQIPGRGWAGHITDPVRATNVRVTDLDQTFTVDPHTSSSSATTVLAATGVLARFGRIYDDVKITWPDTGDNERVYQLLYAIPEARPEIYTAENTGKNRLRARPHPQPVDILSELSEIEENTLGYVFEDRHGQIRYVRSNWHARVGWTQYYDYGLPARFVEALGSWKVGVSDLINRAELYWPKDDSTDSYLATAYEDPTSQAKVGIYATAYKPTQLLNLSDGLENVRQLFYAHVAPAAKPPPLRVDVLRLLEQGEDMLFTNVTGTEVGDLLTLQGVHPRLSPNGASEHRLWVEGIEEHLSADRWDITFHTSPHQYHAPAPT